MRLHKIRKNKYVFILILILLLILWWRIVILARLEILFKELRNLDFRKPYKAPTDSVVRLKYILQWTSPSNMPFNYMGVGQETFINRSCPHINCYVTSDRLFLRNITMFDVIAFAGPDLDFNPVELPKHRSPHQKYVFASIESAANYPICDPKFDRYFNWTWTYKLDSDSRWGYLVVRDINGRIVGPNKEMHWIKHEDMLPVSEDVQKQLQGKRKLAVWFVSNCVTYSGREDFVVVLRHILRRYKQTIDVYGDCGDLKCPRNYNETQCEKMIKDNYYFYMALENAFSEDYVTEKVLHGLRNNAVPIVYGGANYSRFLPPHSYIDANMFKIDALAEKMYHLSTNFQEYVEYFRWTNHYILENTADSVITDDYCAMCALLNDEQKLKETKIYNNFRLWWNPPVVEDQCMPIRNESKGSL